MIYTENKKATFNYEVLEKYEGGLSLLGLEVKSIKSKKVNLEGSYVIVRGGEIFLVGATVQPYQVNNTPKEYDPVRLRKILVTKKELKKIVDVDNKKGLTLIPISLYNKNNKIKLEFALARGKKKSDKRETIKTRESEREIERTLKNQR